MKKIHQLTKDEACMGSGHEFTELCDMIFELKPEKRSSLKKWLILHALFRKFSHSEVWKFISYLHYLENHTEAKRDD